MDTDFIDLIYQNEEVEGVAVFSTTGELIENQLALTTESVTIVSETIAVILSSLQQAERKLKGFLLKSDNITIQICVYNHIILVMELADPCSANKVEKSVRSILSGIMVKPVLNIPAVQQPRVVAEPQVAVVEQPQVVEDEVVADLIGFTEFRSKITKLLKRVAPGGIADKMINGVLKTEGVDPSSESIDRTKAIQIGQMIVDKIPNASRRKIISKEYQSLIKDF